LCHLFFFFNADSSCSMGSSGGGSGGAPTPLTIAIGDVANRKATTATLLPSSGIVGRKTGAMLHGFGLGWCGTASPKR
jgi:hypothetical protein